MTKAAAALIAFIAAALPLHAGILFDPPVANAHTSVDIIVHGVSSVIPPQLDGIEISARTISVRMLSSTCPIAAPVAWRSAAHAGVLAAGVYEVVVTYDGSRGESATLIVRDDAFSATRYALPMDGGDVQFSSVATLGGVEIRSVSVDGGPWLGRDGWTFHIPPHAPGTVDVKATTELGQVITARALLTFFDPTAPPAPALFEPILFPIAFSGGGAFGAQWSTTNRLRADRETWFRSPLPCDGCSDSIDFFRDATLAPGGAPGHLLWVERGTASNLRLTSRARENTRGAVTPIPVFRERDGRYGDLLFLEVPRLPDARAILRVWSMSDDAALTLYVIVTRGTDTELAQAAMARPAAGMPYLAIVDLTSAFEKLGGDVSIRVRTSNGDPLDSRNWALLSLTDNATQQTVIVPSAD